MHRLSDIQSAIRAEGLDGWLLYDFKGLNPIALRVAGIPGDRFISRRWACFIPASGEPRWIAHAIEAGGLRDLAPDIAMYISWQSWRDGLAAILTGAGRVAMEVSPGCAIPYVSRVDAGTVELIRSLGVEIVTSADLVQVAEAVWTAEQLASHRRACAALIEIKDATFGHVRERLAAGQPVTECSVQDFMLMRFAEHGLETDHPPIVAINAHAADPHFAPRRDADTPLRPGGFLLLDLWGREPHPDAIYGDITCRARDVAVAFASERLRAGQIVYGYEVDDACRAVIAQAGFGPRFIHRTGHSIGTSGHGNGVNLDNLETQDRRRLITGVGFSVEPGIYLPEEGFGVRLEINCYVAAADIEVTTLPLQDEMAVLV